MAADQCFIEIKILGMRSVQITSYLAITLGLRLLTVAEEQNRNE
ncbi:hypothetical protein SAMN06265348_10454 [Pedobacter westerhofensis]|uniref:Uncharacterized protein n=1 Tax=Pedobacter westerhofensis TaxID=425512 RepID=A0A521CM44_9SPHI|nr:hypothetical protein SAMN06265348_10454 [Pedobacter westerhofensis]